MIDFEEVEHLARLSRIEMSDGEKRELQKDLEKILDYVKQIQEVTDEVRPLLSGHRNVMREDGEPHESGKYTKDLLDESPHEKKGYFVVKKIIESKK